MDDVDDCARSGGFQVLEERPCVATVSIRGVYALRGEVIQLLEIGIPISCDELGPQSSTVTLTSRSPSHTRI